MKSKLKKDEDATVASADVATIPGVLGDPKKRKNKQEKKVIKETEDFKFYEEDGRKIFEIMNAKDHDNFRLGLQKHNYRYWRQFKAGEELLEIMQYNRSKTFTVRFGKNDYRPFAMGM